MAAVDREWRADALGRLGRSTGRDAFIRRFPHPFLLVQEEENETPSWDTDIRTFEGCAQPSRAPIRYIALMERPGSAYPGKLWIGRTPNCDIIIKEASVSKLHACLHTDADAAKWRISDMHSANGTFVNGQQLAIHEPAPIRPGDAVQFGSVSALFVDAAMLYDHLRRRSQPPATEPAR